MQDIIKTAAAIIPRSGLKYGSSLSLFFTSLMPFATKGSATAYHAAAHFIGSNPSDRCMLSLLPGQLQQGVCYRGGNCRAALCAGIRYIRYSYGSESLLCFEGAYKADRHAYYQCRHHLFRLHKIAYLEQCGRRISNSDYSPVHKSGSLSHSDNSSSYI